jgi:hypothetical protein
MLFDCLIRSAVLFFFKGTGFKKIGCERKIHLILSSPLPMALKKII